eukprot:scaffold163207_cov19-Tisochrysis_lutea.AAC.1
MMQLYKRNALHWIFSLVTGVGKVVISTALFAGRAFSQYTGLELSGIRNEEALESWLQSEELCGCMCYVLYVKVIKTVPGKGLPTAIQWDAFFKILTEQRFVLTPSFILYIFEPVVPHRALPSWAHVPAQGYPAVACA